MSTGFRSWDESPEAVEKYKEDFNIIEMNTNLAEVTHRNKIRGNNLEREIVNDAKKIGLSAKRAYASDGRSLGKSEVVT